MICNSFDTNNVTRGELQPNNTSRKKWNIHSIKRLKPRKTDCKKQQVSLIKNFNCNCSQGSEISHFQLRCIISGKIHGIVKKKMGNNLSQEGSSNYKMIYV